MSQNATKTGVSEGDRWGAQSDPPIFMFSMVLGAARRPPKFVVVVFGGGDPSRVHAKGVALCERACFCLLSAF